jgi:hypothetical protein
MWVIGLLMIAGLLAFDAATAIAPRRVFSLWGPLRRRERLSAVTTFAARAVFVGALANIAVYCTVALAIGGSAAAGKVEGGRYYLASHWGVTEVSREVWAYSDYHTRSIRVTNALALLALVVMELSRRLFGVSELRPVTIAVGRDGGVRVDGRPATVEEAVARARSPEAADLVRVEREYPPEAAPPEALRLFHELLRRGALVRTIDRPRRHRSRRLGKARRGG